MRRSTGLAIGGLVVSLSVPVLSIAVAATWSAGAVQLEPDGGLVAALEVAWLPSLVVSPVALLAAAWGAGVRTNAGWIALVLWGFPLLGLIHFIAAAWLGGLAGEPL